MDSPERPNTIENVPEGARRSPVKAFSGISWRLLMIAVIFCAGGLGLYALYSHGTILQTLSTPPAEFVPHDTGSNHLGPPVSWRVPDVQHESHNFEENMKLLNVYIDEVLALHNASVANLLASMDELVATGLNVGHLRLDNDKLRQGISYALTMASQARPAIAKFAREYRNFIENLLVVNTQMYVALYSVEEATAGGAFEGFDPNDPNNELVERRSTAIASWRWNIETYLKKTLPHASTSSAAARSQLRTVGTGMQRVLDHLFKIPRGRPTYVEKGLLLQTWYTLVSSAGEAFDDDLRTWIIQIEGRLQGTRAAMERCFDGTEQMSDDLQGVRVALENIQDLDKRGMPMSQQADELGKILRSITREAITRNLSALEAEKRVLIA